MARSTIGAVLAPAINTQVRFLPGFWQQRREVNRKSTLQIQYEQCKSTGRIDALKQCWKPGDPGEVPHIFWDSDVAKWIEAAACSIATHPDAELEAQLDYVIDLLAKAQQPDGYLNTHFTQMRPSHRWNNLRDDHELYCAGHLIEAAVAHFDATGKRTMLDVLCRYADYIGQVFGVGEEQKRGYCGHEEIELALMKLARATGQQKYADLAKYFIDERGQQPHYFDLEAVARGEDPKKFYFKTYDYNQSHKPVREQTVVEGHAVRAMYLYCGMTDVAAAYNDKELLKAAHALWKDVTTKKLYLTGGIGPSRHNEGFTSDYDMPNETAYCETCAAVALAFWAQRLALLEPDGRYTDVMERCLYNGSISGVSLDGTKFFYVNPLQSSGSHHRQAWFGCACCPPNLARLLASLGEYVYSTNKDSLYVHLYTASESTLSVGDDKVMIKQTTQYPWDGKVTLKLTGVPKKAMTLALRIPGWCEGAKLRVAGKNVVLKPVMKKGYATIKRMWAEGDEVTLDLPMPVVRIEARPEVKADTARVALQRGPVVYCLEAADNGAGLDELMLSAKTKLSVKHEAKLLGGVTVISGKAARRSGPKWGEELYRPATSKKVEQSFRAVPYYAWDNRKAGEMLVWLREG
jgi:uncharacterized protein